MKKRGICATCALAFALFLSGCGGLEWNGKGEWLNMGSLLPQTQISFPKKGSGSSVTVHDPSIFYDEASGKYYAFGSHFAVASSADLLAWRQENFDGNAAALYGTDNFRSVLKKSSEYVGNPTGEINSTWAPDVERIGNEYYMYYSLTEKFGSGKSVIGRVRAQSPLGVYSGEEIIVQSSGRSYEPNCIDPELFYDKEDRLWMVYGSFYGGIYIKELYADGRRAGLPKEEGFGKLLWKGGGTGVEGPFIFYCAETDYYYLMVSDGSLSSNYQMRVARSRTPDGTYLDKQGNDVASRYGGGVKLCGNYRLDERVSYAAVGHNSVIKVNGKYLAVSHTRMGEGENVSAFHRLRVSQLYLSQDDWLCMSPAPYAGEEKGLTAEEQVIGEWELLKHTDGLSTEFATTVSVTVEEGGRITQAGQAVGEWRLKEGYYMELSWNGSFYCGVVAPIFNEKTQKGGLSFTVLSENNSLWGYQKDVAN